MRQPSRGWSRSNHVIFVILLVTLGSSSQVEAGYGDFSLVPTGWPLSDMVSDEPMTSWNLTASQRPSATQFMYKVKSLSDRFKFKFGSYSDIESIERLDNQERVASEASSSKPKISPVILMPGYGGSRLEARWDKDQVEHYFCDSHSDWTDIWINVKLLLPYMIDCLIENMRLEFDGATNTTKNTNGVEIRTKEPNTLSSVEYLNNLRISSFAYFAPLIRKLTMGSGYKRELNIHGAPYDFRKAPNELADYFVHLEKISEQTYKQNDNQPVSFICHSMGCNNVLYFLQRRDQAWKDKYVRRVVSIAAPWAGALSALRAVALGDNLGMPYLFDESKLIRVQRSLPSTIYLFPHKRAFPDAPLIKSNVGRLNYDITAAKNPLIVETQPQTSIPNVSSNSRVFNAHDYKGFFESINHPDGYKMWLNTKDLLGSLEAPGVEVWCLVGRGQRTLGRMEYEGRFPDSPSIEFHDDGDGTVTLQSAKYCKEWAKEQTQPIYVKEFEVSHMDILKDQQVIKYVERILDSQFPTETKFVITQNIIQDS